MAAAIEMTEITQTQDTDRKALDWGQATLYAALGVLLIVLGVTSHFNIVSEQISMVLSLVLIGVAIATIWDWARSYKTDGCSVTHSFP